MNFDASRLAKLAGLPVGEARTLTEASNRSRHEDPAVSDENDFRYGKGQLAEGSDEEAKEEMDMDEAEEENLSEMVEIDEAMLQNEIKRMRKERIEENALRSVIRGEIGSILEDLKGMSSNRKEDTSRFDGITKGFPGPGFR